MQSKADTIKESLSIFGSFAGCRINKKRKLP